MESVLLELLNNAMAHTSCTSEIVASENPKELLDEDVVCEFVFNLADLKFKDDQVILQRLKTGKKQYNKSRDDILETHLIFTELDEGDKDVGLGQQKCLSESPVVIPDINGINIDIIAILKEVTSYFLDIELQNYFANMDK